MAQEQSIFPLLQDVGALQNIVSGLQDQLYNPFWRQYLTMAAPQISLNFSQVLDGNALATAASIVSRDSETPLRARDVVKLLSGELPPIRVMRKLSETQYREFLSLQSITNIDSATRNNQQIQLIWDDVKYVAEAVDLRLDYLLLQMLSTGKIDINVSNNPDGIIISDVDLGLDSGNKIVVSGSKWETVGSADPIKDFQDVVSAARAKGYSLGKALMNPSTYSKFINTTKVKDYFKNVIITQQGVNEVLVGAGLPPIEIVDRPIPVEEDGERKITTPFADNKVAFIPNGQLGVIKNAVATEALRPVKQVDYANVNRTLISKWSQNEPFGEWTKSELNAFPVLSSINNIFILTTTK